MKNDNVVTISITTPKTKKEATTRLEVVKNLLNSGVSFKLEDRCTLINETYKLQKFLKNS